MIVKYSALHGTVVFPLYVSRTTDKTPVRMHANNKLPLEILSSVSVSKTTPNREPQGLREYALKSRSDAALTRPLERSSPL